MTVSRDEFSQLEHRVCVLETTSGPGRIDVLFDVIHETQDDVRKLAKTVGRHGRLLEGHSKVLDEHTAKLDEHTAKLDQHTAKLDEHTQMLNEHGVMLRKIVKHFGIE